MQEYLEECVTFWGGPGNDLGENYGKGTYGGHMLPPCASFGVELYKFPFFLCPCRKGKNGRGEPILGKPRIGSVWGRLMQRCYRSWLLPRATLALHYLFLIS
jgi:hypothetical protein